MLLLAGSYNPISAASDPNELMAQHVYDRLVRAAGIMNPPKLVVQRASPGSPNRVAFMRTTPGSVPRREIVIDDKTIAICQKMGAQSESCMAYFLGHELAHFANNHNWGAHFALQTVDIGLTPAQSLEYETQADRFGGFYAALAGYDSLSVAGRALESVYREYGIAPKLDGYLSLAERQKVPETEREFLSRLMPMWDAAGLLMALGDYQEAAALYDAILAQFPSREVYNNAGVALASLYDSRPAWLLDSSTRLPAHGGRRGSVDLKAVSTQARDYFEKAIQLDRDYAVAHWNLGLLLKAMGEPERAAVELKDAARLAKGIESIQPEERTVGSDSSPCNRTALLDGKRPADMVPAGRGGESLGGGVTFFWRTLNDHPVFSVGLIGPDRKRVIAVLLPEVPEACQGHLGSGKEIRLFPENAVLYEPLGVFVGVRGALVYQVR